MSEAPGIEAWAEEKPALDRKVPDDLAVCIFGSFARGEATDMGDKDVLIVTDYLEQIPKELIASWAHDGWEASYYTWPNIYRKGAQGNLFIQHLKTDGIIIDDKAGHLVNLFAEYSPKEDYSAEVERANETLKVIARQPVNDGQAQMLCASLFRYLRHRMIYELAHHKAYPTRFDDILYVYSERIKKLAAPDQDLIGKLQDSYRAYKQRLAPDKTGIGLLSRGKALVTRLYNLEFDDIPGDAPARKLSPGATIREIEALLVSKYAAAELDKGEIMRDIWALVQNPRHFNWAADGEVNEETLASINGVVG